MSDNPNAKWPKLPVIPPLPPDQPDRGPNPPVAVCGECGIEIRQVMHVCGNPRCPVFPRVTCGRVA